MGVPSISSAIQRLHYQQDAMKRELAGWNARRRAAEDALEAVERRLARVEAVAKTNEKAIEERHAQLNILLGSMAATPVEESERLLAPVMLAIAEHSEDEYQDKKSKRKVARDRRAQRESGATGVSHGGRRNRALGSDATSKRRGSVANGEEATEWSGSSTDEDGNTAEAQFAGATRRQDQRPPRRDGQVFEDEPTGYLDFLDLDARTPNRFNRNQRDRSESKPSAKDRNRANAQRGITTPARSHTSITSSSSGSGLFVSEHPRGKPSKRTRRRPVYQSTADKEDDIANEGVSRESDQSLSRSAGRCLNKDDAQAATEMYNRDPGKLLFNTDESTAHEPVGSPPPGWPWQTNDNLFVTPDAPSGPSMALQPQRRGSSIQKSSISKRRQEAEQKQKTRRKARRRPSPGQIEAAAEEKANLRNAIGKQVMAGIDEPST